MTRTAIGVLAASAALAVAGPGAAVVPVLPVDTTFGVEGAVGPVIDGVQLGKVTSLSDIPGGGVLVGGALADGAQVVLRLTPRGRLDPGFGSAGVLRVPEAEGSAAFAPSFVGADGLGRILVAQLVSDPVVISRTDLTRFTAQGAVDASFGSGGRTSSPIPSPIVALAPDGGVVLAQRNVPALPLPGLTPARVTVARLLPSGVLDPAFGAGGVARVGAPRSVASPIGVGVLDLDVDRHGRPVVGAFWRGPNGAEAWGILRLGVNGAPDPGFAGGRPALTPLPPLDLVAQADGGVAYVTTGTRRADRVFPMVLGRRTAVGARDATVGPGGQRDLGVGPTASFAPRLRVAANGRLVAVAGTVVVLTDRRGKAVPRFGEAGVARLAGRGAEGLPMVDSAGRLVLNRGRASAPSLVRVALVPVAPR